MNDRITLRTPAFHANRSLLDILNFATLAAAERPGRALASGAEPPRKGWIMRRMKRFWGGLLIAALLLGGFAPASSAETPLSPVGWFASISVSVANWWAAFTGGNEGRGTAAAASEGAPTDADGLDPSPSLDPASTDTSTTSGSDDSEVTPSIDPNG